jgi:hypothetical protein
MDFHRTCVFSAKHVDGSVDFTVGWSINPPGINWVEYRLDAPFSISQFNVFPNVTFSFSDPKSVMLI